MVSRQNLDHLKAIIDSIPNGEFEIEEILGNGFFNGTVIVKNKKLAGRIEKIKFLESVEPSIRAQFVKEGKILSAIQHKNIPRIYDILEYGDVLLFRSEHIEGYTLREVLDYLKDKKEEFPRFAAASIISKLASALNYAHNEVRYDDKRRSIIHCDIKPSNIILSAKGHKRKNKVDKKFIGLLKENKIEPFIVDFGISMFKGVSHDENGTIFYMSPAQLKKGSKDINWRTDAYQLLLVYHEMLTKETPYYGLSRTKIIDVKSKQDFKVEQKIHPRVRYVIETGTKRDQVKSFRTEKQFLNRLSEVEICQRQEDFINKNRKPILISLSFVLMLLFSAMFYTIYDYSVMSTDAMIMRIERNNNASLDDMESALHKIQVRAFEKKYYLPLIRGEFRDKKTGKPMYPYHVDAKGRWVLVGADSEPAGIFVGLLFNYSDRYPALKKYAIEYAEPILQSEFDGSNEKRFMYALIPAYDKTQDVRYLKKLVNVTDTLIEHLEMNEGVTQINNMYLEKMFMFVYEKTGDKKYFEIYENYLSDFIKNNIDSDGFVYEYVSINATSIYGKIDDDKISRLTISIDTHPIGNLYFIYGVNISRFKEITSVFSRDYMEIITSIYNLYYMTNDIKYIPVLKNLLKYYVTESPKDYVDLLFVSNIYNYTLIPKDITASMKSIHFLSKSKNKIYLHKLKSILSQKYFQKEHDSGIISGSVLIENAAYVNSDNRARNQTTIEADALFLELR